MPLWVFTCVHVPARGHLRDLCLPVHVHMCTRVYVCVNVCGQALWLQRGQDLRPSP